MDELDRIFAEHQKREDVLFEEFKRGVQDDIRKAAARGALVFAVLSSAATALAVLVMLLVRT